MTKFAADFLAKVRDLAGEVGMIDDTRALELAGEVQGMIDQIDRGEASLDAGDGVRSITRPTNIKDGVTRASRLLVHAAGGEIVVPFHLADIVDEIELDQVDEPWRSRVVYRTKHAKGAAAAVVDVEAVPSGPRRIAHMKPGEELSGTVIEG